MTKWQAWGLFIIGVAFMVSTQAWIDKTTMDLNEFFKKYEQEQGQDRKYVMEQFNRIEENLLTHVHRYYNGKPVITVE